MTTNEIRAAPTKNRGKDQGNQGIEDDFPTKSCCYVQF